MAADFFYDNFWGPIVEQGVAGYNVINTPVYAVLFAVAVFVSYKLLKKLNIRIGRNFVIGVFPFIVLGSVLRVVRDSKIVPSPLLVSPLIYFSLFFIAVISLLISVAVDRYVIRGGRKGGTGYFGGKDAGGEKDRVVKEIRSKLEIGCTKTESGAHLKAAPTSHLVPSFVPGIFSMFANFFTKGGHSATTARFEPSSYYKIWAVIGWILVIYGLFLLSPLGIKNVFALEVIAGISAVFAVVLFFLYKTHKIKLLSLENTGLIWAHLFDAATTFTALQFFASAGYYEQHVVSNIVIGFLGPAGQFVLKLVVVPVVLWALDKELPAPENRFLRNFLKVAILIVGFAPGLRNGIRLVLGV